MKTNKRNIIKIVVVLIVCLYALISIAYRCMSFPDDVDNSVLECIANVNWNDAELLGKHGFNVDTEEGNITRALLENGELGSSEFLYIYLNKTDKELTNPEELQTYQDIRYSYYINTNLTKALFDDKVKKYTIYTSDYKITIHERYHGNKNLLKNLLKDMLGNDSH